MRTTSPEGRGGGLPRALHKTLGMVQQGVEVPAAQEGVEGVMEHLRGVNRSSIHEMR